MTNIEDIMLKRESFPILVGGERKRRNHEIIPPFHPSIQENGIDVQLAKTCLDEAISGYVADHEENGLFLFDYYADLEPVIVTDTEQKYHIGRIAFLGSFVITPSSFGKLGPGFDNVVNLSPGNEGSVNVSNEFPLSSRIVEEYGLVRGAEFDDTTSYDGLLGWTGHNLDSTILHKNFMIALNNATVRELYS